MLTQLDVCADCSFADSGSGSYVDAETYGGGNESGSGSWDEGCPGGDESLFAQAFTIGALATSLGVTVGNVAFGYVLTLWGTKARAVILTLNSLVTDRIPLSNQRVKYLQRVAKTGRMRNCGTKVTEFFHELNAEVKTAPKWP